MHIVINKTRSHHQLLLVRFDIKNVDPMFHSRHPYSIQNVRSLSENADRTALQAGAINHNATYQQKDSSPVILNPLNDRTKTGDEHVVTRHPETMLLLRDL